MQGAQEVGVWVLVALMIIPAVKTLIDLVRPQKRELQQPLNVRPDIPSHDRYAPKEHVHPQYLTRQECADRHATEERREDARSTEIKAMLTALSVKVDLHSQEAEQRASKLHLRLDPLPPAITAAREVLDNHLEDHRAGRAS